MLLEFPCEAFWFYNLFSGRIRLFFKYKYNFTTSDHCIQIIYFFLTLDRLCVARYLSFPLDCPVSWHITVHNIPLWFFCISVILVLISLLSFLILFIWLLFLFFFVRLVKDLSVLVIIFKKLALCFTDLFYFFFYFLSERIIKTLVN